MLNFTIGPVMSSEGVCQIGGEQVPYFRTPEFSAMMLESEKLMLEFADAPEDSRVAFMTGSGTASMEATVSNMLCGDDKVLIIDGGGFGHRFVQLLELYGIPHEVLRMEPGKKLTDSAMEPYDGKGFTAVMVNLHETSTGVLYDIDVLSRFARENEAFFIVDAISAFLADEISMKDHGVDVMITGSQKALACPPGVSIIVLDEKAIARLERIPSRCMYLDLKDALKNGERGQTPFTPAVGVLRQINYRLKQIKSEGGVEGERERIAAIAEDFRSKIGDLPLEVASESMSNAVTPIRPLGASAKDIFMTLKDEYGIWICPNGGEFEHTLFRVGHIGFITQEDNDKLIEALHDMKKRGLI